MTRPITVPIVNESSTLTMLVPSICVGKAFRLMMLTFTVATAATRGELSVKEARTVKFTQARVLMLKNMYTDLMVPVSSMVKYGVPSIL